MNKFLTKFNRISAYILIVLFLVIMITGYRQTGHFTFIGRGLASSLHQVYINIAFLVLFTVHTLLGVRMALTRNKIKGIYIEVLLIILGLLVIAGFSYFAFF